MVPATTHAHQLARTACRKDEIGSHNVQDVENNLIREIVDAHSEVGAKFTLYLGPVKKVALHTYWLEIYYIVCHTLHVLLDGPMVRICRSHRQGQGSIPCLGITFSLH